MFRTSFFAFPLVALAIACSAPGRGAARSSVHARLRERPLEEPRAATIAESHLPIDAPVAPSSFAPAAALAEADDASAAVLRPDLGGGMVLTGASAHRMILFTFDDGPHPWHTRRLLEHLARADVRGVFFVNAHRFDAETGWYADCANVVREAALAGHIIASHGRDHALTAGLEGDALDAQVIGAESIFQRVLGARPWLFRPPGGRRSAATDVYLSERGYTQMLWTLHTGDYETRDTDEVLRNFRASVIARENTSTPGGIAVIHDSHPWGVAAFPRMMRFLQRRNCELIERGEELYEVVDDPRLLFVPRSVGSDPSEIAPAVRLAADELAARQERLREREGRRCDAVSE